MFLISSFYVIGVPDRTDGELFDTLLAQLNFEGNLLNETSGRNVECSITNEPIQNTTIGIGIVGSSMNTFQNDGIQCATGGNQLNMTYSTWLRAIQPLSGSGNAYASRKPDTTEQDEPRWHAVYDDNVNRLEFNIDFVSGTTSLRHFAVDPFIEDETIFHVCNSYNHTNGTLFMSSYFNGTLLSVFDSRVQGQTEINNTINLTIGGQTNFGSNNQWRGIVDEVNYFNSSLTSGECQRLFDLGNAGLHLEGDTTDPAVTIEAPTPANNSFSTSIIQVFNLTVVEDNLDTITLNFNGTNETGFVNDFGNSFSLTKNTGAEGLFTYQIHVNDKLGNEFVSGTFQFTVDNTTPVITYTNPLLDNSTVETSLTGSIDINGFYINLDIANLTVTNATDFQVFQNITTGLTVSSFTFTNDYSEILTGQPNGTYKFRTCFIDDVNIENCADANMTFQEPLVVAPAITARVTLPLENAVNIVGMVVLFIFLIVSPSASSTHFRICRYFDLSL